MKFSVIIPTYSRIDLLQKALKSVDNQTYKNYEIIVINDNPIEKTTVDTLISNYSKAKVIHHAQPKGGNAARNSGIQSSNSELIAFLDDDDIWLPEKLAEHATAHQKNPQAGLVYSDCLYVYNNKLISDKIYSAPVPQNVIGKMGAAKFCPATSSIVSIKRECVEKCGLFDESLVSFQDWDYWFRIAHYFKFVNIPKVLAHYTQHAGDRTSHNENKRINGLNQIRDKWAKKINVDEFTKTSVISIYYKNSKNALMAGEQLSAFKKSLKLLNPNVLSARSFKTFLKLSLESLKLK